MDLFTNITVIEILKLGLSGFCFLLAFLGYLLLRKEQTQAKPRTSILSTIRYFLAFSVILGLLVGILSLFGGGSTTNPPPEEGEYVIEHTFHRLDLRKFTPVDKSDIATPKSFVVSERTDFLRKITDQDVSFRLPLYTTGLQIDHTPVMNSVGTEFMQVQVPGDENKKSYEFVLPIGAKPRGHYEILRNRFTFVNGFRDEKAEWFTASIKYPTKAIAVLLIFPDNKPCKQITAYRQQGISAKQKITDNPPAISEDGQLTYWLGTNEKPDSRIHFEWTW